MKKLSILPVAERSSENCADNDIRRTKDLGKDLPFWAYVLYYAGMLFAFSRSIMAGLCMFGAVFIIMPLDVKTKISRNGHSVGKNMWNCVPFFIIGSALITFCIACQFGEKESHETGTSYTFTKTSNMIITHYAAVVAAVMIGRLIYLIVTAFAIADRKKVCTVPVSIELENNMFTDDVRIFRYCYEGETYRFIDHEEQVWIVYDPVQKKHRITLDQVYIDPNEPECYYSRRLFGYNSKWIKNYFKTLFFFLFITSFFWLAPVYRYILDHIYN